MKRLFFLLFLSLLFLPSIYAQRREVSKVKTVVIDPGHGGNKPGAIGKSSKEKDVVLSIAKKFGKLINDNYPDVKVIFTRSSDVDIALSERAHIANSNKADLFISIHANSHPTASPTGVETFVMGLSKSKANMDVAKKENADILLESNYKTNSAYQGFDPNAPESSIIFSMFQNAYIDKSLNFAGFIQKQYNTAIKTVNRGVKQAEFMVLYMSAMPAVLTEVGFISNPTEEAYMTSNFGQAQIAVCLFNAFATYKNKEDGSPIPSKPVIDLPGYGKNAPQEPQPQKPKPPVEPAHDSLSVANADSVAPAPAPEVLPAAPTADSCNTPLPPAPPELPVFKVQFLSSEEMLSPNSRLLKGQTDYETISENGTVRYLKGAVHSIKEAKSIQTELREAGFKDAFVVAFYKGEKISIQKARELLRP